MHSAVAKRNGRKITFSTDASSEELRGIESDDRVFLIVAKDEYPRGFGIFRGKKHKPFVRDRVDRIERYLREKSH